MMKPLIIILSFAAAALALGTGAYLVTHGWLIAGCIFLTFAAGFYLLAVKAQGWTFGNRFTFQVRCAWCKRRERGNPFAKQISHSICPKCSERVLSQRVLRRA